MFNRLMKQEKGFSIIQLIVVIAVIGMLMVVLIPNFSNIFNSLDDLENKRHYSDINTYIYGTFQYDKQTLPTIKDVQTYFEGDYNFKLTKIVQQDSTDGTEQYTVGVWTNWNDIDDIPVYNRNDAPIKLFVIFDDKSDGSLVDEDESYNYQPLSSDFSNMNFTDLTAAQTYMENELDEVRVMYIMNADSDVPVQYFVRK